ncbi:hypothetical protein BJ322DRAFT_1207633 [Thelephora terrestris]|uniref:Uncharacterized protein n=1 Tax=Thelephora terrestris TaxID=56493 RepID=A0A9P6HRC7_9AGAM|nr:hypothetical protein BJ322DRAFT_1207633 [Thelephora terrestris]
MPTAELYVATYAPRHGSMSHWAIYLRVIPTGAHSDDEDECQHLIYQANGPENELELDVSAANPRKSRRSRELIFVSNIDSTRDIEEIKTKLTEQPMMNHIAAWSCQDWVMESLDTLEEEELWTLMHMERQR